MNNTHGFLPTRGDWIMDVVVIAMFLLLFFAFHNVWQIKKYKNIIAHRNRQLLLTFVLIIVVVFFARHLHATDWESLAEMSPYYKTNLVQSFLDIHLCFAKPLLIFWFMTIICAYWFKKFTNFGGI